MARKFTSRGLTVCAGRGASPPGTASIAGFLAPARSLQLRSPSPADSGVSSEQRRSSTFPSASANGVLFFRLRQDHHESSRAVPVPGHPGRDRLKYHVIPLAMFLGTFAWSFVFVSL